ncbi:MAG: APC family permease [Chloroflexota bacterium]|nr:MAG: APC family permease [Chloroflexota bacterium]
MPAEREVTPAHVRTRGRIGPFLCWAVVFADIGTSVYYTPGILYGRFGTRAALFVAMTLLVFVLLAIKYAEVAARYPEGGGVVTVSTRAFHPFVGLTGGMFILVDYFLTAALSALSGVIYLSVVFKSLGTIVILGTVGALVILALLNLIGIKASAEASAVFAVTAGILQLAVVAAIIMRLGPAHMFDSIHQVLAGPRLTPIFLLTGYAGAFLAFSGLESIAQLSPALADPRRRVANLGMGLVVVTIGRDQRRPAAYLRQQHRPDRQLPRLSGSDPHAIPATGAGEAESLARYPALGDRRRYQHPGRSRHPRARQRRHARRSLCLRAAGRLHAHFAITRRHPLA